MRWLRVILNWGLCPQPPGFIACFSPEWMFCICSQGTALTCPPPFRPLNRSLGLLPSIALSRPAQVGPVSTKSLSGSMENQRTAITPLTRCLTPGVHFTEAEEDNEE